MTCDCRQNYDDTKITQPCLKHAQFAREYAATVFAERVAKADAAAGKGTAPRANVSTPWEESR